MSQTKAVSNENDATQSNDHFKTHERVSEPKNEIKQDEGSKTEISKGIMWWKTTPPPPKLPCEFLTPNDSKDPSYTQLTLPYRVICRQRYQGCAKKYRKQFITEIKRQEAMQFRALDGIRIRREFCEPLIEKLPSKDRIKLSPKQQYRLDELLKTNF